MAYISLRAYIIKQVERKLSLLFMHAIYTEEKYIKKYKKIYRQSSSCAIPHLINALPALILNSYMGSALSLPVPVW